MTDTQPAPTNLIEALAAAQGEMRAAQMDATNPAFRSKYATLASVIDAVREPLARHKIAWQQRLHPSEGGIAIETCFYGHGDSLSSGILVVPVAQRSAQGLGSALTYARRYSLSLACGIAADEDDDGNAATKDAPPPVATVTKAQAGKLRELIAITGTDMGSFLKAMGVSSIEKVPADRLDWAVRRLEEKRGEMVPE
jgi:hypothetical protein